MNTWTPRFIVPTVRRLASGVILALALAPGFAQAQPQVNLEFSSPATNSAPGATFSGGFNFGPAGASVSGSIVAGADIVPPSNLTITGGGTNRTVFLDPLPNQSGSVTARLEAVNAGSTGSVDFVVVFRPYPPVISAVGNRTIPEDGSTNVPFTVSDPDTPVGDLVVTATSSNTNLVQAVLGGSGSNRTVQLTPLANINGSSTITITADDGLHTTNRVFTLTVTPVADPSTISGLVNRAFGDNSGVTNVFTGASIADVDHQMPNNESLVATATLANDQFATFANGQIVQAFTGFPAQVTAAIAGVGVQPLPFRSIPGTINNLSASVRVRGVSDSITVTSTVTLAIEVINTPPSFAMNLSPTSVVEGTQAQPFQILFIYDPDIGEDQFTLSVQLVNTNQAGLLNIAPTNTVTDNSAGLLAAVQNLIVQANPGVLTSLTEQVAFRFLLSDGYGGTTAETNVLTLVQSQSPPQISGIPVQTINKTDADPAFTVFPTVFVQDQNQGGLQPVRATLAQSNPALGSFSATNFVFQTPAQLSLALQSVTYTPAPGALPVGAIGESTITLVATDLSGLSASNNSVKVRITSVNLAPQFLNVPPPVDQPVLIPPAAQVLPFAEIGLWNDDTNAINPFTLTLDNVNKGSLTNLGAFTQTSPGVYSMTGSIASVLASLTNIAYTLNPFFTFPPDDPGGTVFTLSARDYALLTTVASLYIQIQEEPRNHLVVRAANDGLPGSFTYALANAGNNDVITFALPAYPAVIRMPGSSPSTLERNVTIKGPGANLLAISGDGNGDTIPDRQLFRIRSRVTLEGVTLTHGTASFGGAVLVESNGFLTLRRCAVVDSTASQYGGAMDVDGGQLTLDGCFIGRNRLSQDTGVSAAGVSVYSDKEIQIINTTFAGNVQPNATGDGGGALVVQRRSPGVFMNAYVTHCTFIGNEDAAGLASAALSVDSGTRIRAANSIFSDYSGRNIEVNGTGDFISHGGNICDDSTRTLNLQSGQSGDVFLLDHLTDDTLTDPLLAPLNLSGDPTPFAEPLAGSPAINKGFGSTTSIDQRGVLRHGLSDAGAAEFNALGRLVINEIHFEDNEVSFIELYVRRDSTPIDLAPYSLFIDGVKVHEFAASTIIGTNALHGAGDPAPTVVNPGFGFVVAFTNDPVSVTSDSNPTPVVRASESNAPLRLPTRAVVAIGAGGSAEPVARAAYLGEFLNPASGTNLLDLSGNSIALAPQYRGFALVPHSLILPGPFEGVDMNRTMAANQYSIGADTLGTPFGQDNAEPLAVPDIFTVNEDDRSALLVRANDFDGDGNDRVVIVDISPASDPGAGDAAATQSQLGADLAVSPDDVPLRGAHIVYDPRATTNLQALPVGVEIIDTLYYEVIDYGFAAVEGYSDGTGGTTVVAATNHRLTNGAAVAISGAFPADYNGNHAVTVVDENAFAIGVAFVAATSNGTWETVGPREPTSRSEASVSVRVIGANDPPVANLDVITNVNERQTVRLMVRPELAGAPLVFPGDPVPAPDMLAQSILDNDDDIDSDDSWSTLRAYAVLGSVNAIAGYSGAPGAQPVVVEAPAHGLVSGDQVLIANYGGHPSYNGFHAVTVLNENFFSIPVFFVDDAAEKGVWVVLNEGNRYGATTDVEATVTLTLRANAEEDHLIYDASASDFLQGLAEGERYTNRFYYAVVDTHGAIGIGPIDVVVVGVNNTPAPGDDPGALGQLDPLVGGTNTLAQVLKTGLDLMYTLPPTGGGSNRVNLQVLDLGGTLPGTLVLNDFFTTDENTALPIPAADLLANDIDIDRLDILTVVGVDAFSREGAAVSLGGTTITYNPAVSSNLQALARGELLIDTFKAVVSDGMTGGTVTSLVAVLVVGVNDTPIANPVFLVTHEDEVLVFDPRTNDVERDINLIEPDDRLRIVVTANVANAGLALVNMSDTNVTHDAPVSQLLNQLADWQSFTNVFPYTITDNSFLFATDDEFYVPAGTAGRVLDVLANDRDATDSAGVLTIISAGPTLEGGSVSIGSNGQFLVYSSPAAFVGDDYFRYTIQNDKGDVNSGRVLVRSVVASINGLLHAADDAYTVAAGETAVMNVLANDGVLPPGGGLSILGIVSTSIPGQPILTNNLFVYDATNGLAPLTFRYEISGGGTSTAQADVTLAVVERRGTLEVRDDAFSVLAASFDNELDVLANDALVTAPTAALRIGEILLAPLNGTLTTNEARTRLIYTPNSGFIGVEQVAYLATDELGGTGTGLVSIAVGRVDLAPDFYKIAATTNPVPVGLHVLANDRVLANSTGTLTIISVSPSTPTAIGTLQVHGSGKTLVFTPSNVTGQVEFDYAVQDGGSPARVATSRVTIATVAPGIYANPDRFIVRGGGADYVLNVLTNDISYPNVNKTYTILSIGVGPDAPNQGGLVSIVDNRLVYTPAPGFFGEEAFTYLMSDSVNTDVAQVSVSVRRGDLAANDDAYTVYYQLLPGTNIAAGFTLPVLLNDRILPPLDQVVSIFALGAGTNQPNQGGSLQVSPDNQSLVYRPVLATATSYVEQFTYEISDGGDRRASAVVRVLVQNRASNLVAVTHDDAFAVARNSSNNVLPVLANDYVLPGSAAGWSVTTVSPSLYGAAVSISNATIRYTPAAGFVGVDTFTYGVSDGLGGTGEALVSVRVGSLPTMPDLFTVMAGTTTNELDVLANDPLVTAYTGEYSLHSVFGATAGGAIALSGNNTVLYTPVAAYTGGYPYAETFFYRVADDAAGLVTGRVRVLVYNPANGRATSTITLLVEGRNDQPAIDNPAPPISITDKETVKPFLQVLITEVDQQLQEPIDVTVALDDGAKGVFFNHDGFVEVTPGVWALTNVTAATGTARVRDLIFAPTENRITVPTSEYTYFTITVTDHKSPVVTDTNSSVLVESVNDAPTIEGARSGQTVYQRMPIHLFSAVTITEVDDLTLQPLIVTIRMFEPTNGVLTNLATFVAQTGGVYRATNCTAASASAALRAMQFLARTNPIPAGTSLVTRFTIEVDDQFAPVVTDTNTSVIAFSSFEGQVRPTNALLRGSFGLAVDVHGDFAVVGAPNASANGSTSGAAFVYMRQPGGSNTWVEWRQLQPLQVETNDRFGRSVAISENLIAVGAINDGTGTVRMGTVYLFDRHLGGSNNWGEMVRIVPTNITNAIQFGYSVALDGDRLAVGAPDASLNGATQAQGAVFLFERNQGGSNAWGEVARRVPTEAGITNSDFGWSIALSGDHLVVGAPRTDINAGPAIREGAVFLLSRNEGGPDNWGVLQKIVPPQSNAVVEFGWDVALDGETMAVSAPPITAGATTNAGIVFVYQWVGASNQWLETTRIDRRSDTERRFGHAVALKNNRLFIGAPHNSATQNIGAAYLYRRDPVSPTNWILVNKFTRPATNTAGLYGSAIGLHVDTGIVGAPSDLAEVSNRGYAFLYRFKQNNAPMLAASIPDQFAEVAEPYHFPIPAATFTDPDFEDTLVLSGTFPSGDNGLSFLDTAVTGTPVAIGMTPVHLLATDTSGATADHTFTVIVLDGLTLLGTPRDLWNLDAFGNAVTNPALSGSLWGGDANPDGDWLNNDEEYVFGGDPNTPDDRRITLAPAPDGDLFITYFRRTDDPGLTYVLQGSSNMLAWVDLTWTVISETTVPVDAHIDFVTLRVAVSSPIVVQHYRMLVYP